jgi:geranylgeranyl diphosphate synthase type 3
MRITRSIDDIEDESTLRRGQLAAHLKHGLAPALNSGNYMYFAVNQRVLELTLAHGGDVAKAGMIYLEEMIQLHQGQGIEIYWRTKRLKPSLKEYLKMVEQSEPRFCRSAMDVHLFIFLLLAQKREA